MFGNNTFYVTTPFDLSLYKGTKDTIVKMYQFVFPANRSLSSSAINSKNDFVINNAIKALKHDQKIITDVKNITFINDSSLYFKVSVSNYTMGDESSQSSDQFNFLYNIHSGKLSSFERLTPDALTFYLPFTSFNSRFKGFSYANGYFYTDVSSLKMFAAHEKNKARNPQYTLVLQKYFKTQSRRSNPVIVKMKLKDF